MDPLAPLLELAGVSAAADEARKAIDELLGHPAMRRSAGLVAAESALRSAHASAVLDGADHDLELIRAGAVPDPTVQGALRVAGALDGLVDRWQQAPRQVLARLHLLAARDLVPAAALGRPNAVGPRLDAVSELLTGGTAAPAVIVAGIVHAELLSLGAFDGPNGVVARAAGRLTLMARGFDARGLAVADVGHLRRQPEYVGALNAYATGTPDGVRAWLRHCCAATVVGAEEGLAIAGSY